MSLRRWGRTPKTLAEKGKPGAMARRISIRTALDGRHYEWHPTKGYRRLA